MQIKRFEITIIEWRSAGSAASCCMFRRGQVKFIVLIRQAGRMLRSQGKHYMKIPIEVVSLSSRSIASLFSKALVAAVPRSVLSG